MRVEIKGMSPFARDDEPSAFVPAGDGSLRIFLGVGDDPVIIEMSHDEVSIIVALERERLEAIWGPMPGPKGKRTP